RHSRHIHQWERARQRRRARRTAPPVRPPPGTRPYLVQRRIEEVRMRIVVIGGSRGTGRALAALAVARGHEVVAASRSGTGPDGASAVAVDAADAEALRPMLRGADAVAVTVGPTRGAERARTAVTRAVVAAMAAEGVRRIVVQSSTGVGSSIEH